MCYTIEINLAKAELEKRFGAKTSKLRDFNPRYIVSGFSNPRLPVITIDEPAEFSLFQWGLIPFWVKDENAAADIKTKTLNARAETISEKPSFRDSFKSRRCLIPVHGFFEWHDHAGKKYPFYIKLKNDRAFSLAGIYDNWINKETGELISGFSIITTEANPLIERIHNSKMRMPVILPEEIEKKWIDPGLNTSQAQSLLQSFDEKYLEAHPVAKFSTSKTESFNSPHFLEKFEYPELNGLF
jgi:putative SOS response-associated peptidase YedK